MAEEIRYLTRIRQALDNHNSNCPVPATRIILNPDDLAELAIYQLWGVPVEQDSRIPIDIVRIGCGGSAWCIEEEIDAYANRNNEPADRD